MDNNQRINPLFFTTTTTSTSTASSAGNQTTLPNEDVRAAMTLLGVTPDSTIRRIMLRDRIPTDIDNITSLKLVKELELSLEKLDNHPRKDFDDLLSTWKSLLENLHEYLIIESKYHKESSWCNDFIKRIHLQLQISITRIKEMLECDQNPYLNILIVFREFIRNLIEKIKNDFNLLDDYKRDFFNENFIHFILKEMEETQAVVFLTTVITGKVYNLPDLPAYIYQDVINYTKIINANPQALPGSKKVLYHLFKEYKKCINKDAYPKLIMIRCDQLKDFEKSSIEYLKRSLDLIILFKDMYLAADTVDEEYAWFSLLLIQYHYLFIDCPKTVMGEECYNSMIKEYLDFYQEKVIDSNGIRTDFFNFLENTEDELIKQCFKTHWLDLLHLINQQTPEIKANYKALSTIALKKALEILNESAPSKAQPIVKAQPSRRRKAVASRKKTVEHVAESLASKKIQEQKKLQEKVIQEQRLLEQRQQALVRNELSDTVITIFVPITQPETTLKQEVELLHRKVEQKKESKNAKRKLKKLAAASSNTMLTLIPSEPIIAKPSITPFLLERTTMHSYEKLFRMHSEAQETVTLNEILHLIKAFGSIGEEKESFIYRKDNSGRISERRNGSHLIIQLEGNYKVPANERSNQETFVLKVESRNGRQILLDYSIREAREKLELLGFGPEYVRGVEEDIPSCTTTTQSSE